MKNHEKSVSLMMGQYGVFPSKKVNKVETPGVQTCVTLIITSKDQSYLGFAHIDTSLHARNVTEKIIKQLRSYNKNSIEGMSATLVGGDISDPLTGSSSIYNPIYEALKEAKIPYKHEKYSYSLPLLALPLLYLGLTYLGGLRAGASGFETAFVTFICLAAQFIINNLILPNTYDVAVDLETNEIKVVSNNPENSRRILEEAGKAQIEFLMKRNQLSPALESQRKELELEDVSKKLKLG
jgi:hypothetical protein